MQLWLPDRSTENAQEVSPVARVRSRDAELIDSVAWLANLRNSSSKTPARGGQRALFHGLTRRFCLIPAALLPILHRWRGRYRASGSTIRASCGVSVGRPRERGGTAMEPAAVLGFPGSREDLPPLTEPSRTHFVLWLPKPVDEARAPRHRRLRGGQSTEPRRRASLAAVAVAPLEGVADPGGRLRPSRNQVHHYCWFEAVDTLAYRDGNPREHTPILARPSPGGWRGTPETTSAPLRRRAFARCAGADDLEVSPRRPTSSET